MVLGWGKKNVAKQDEEDMTMDEILASIRRYVTEDQNPAYGADSAKDSATKESHETTKSRHPGAEQTTAPDNNSPYMSARALREQQENQDRSLSQEEPTLKHESESDEFCKTKQQYQPEYAAEMTAGVSSEATISAAALALSKLAEARTEQQDAGAITLDVLIANLARPMIKEWMDKHLPQIVETMVEREIARIRTYSSK